MEDDDNFKRVYEFEGGKKSDKDAKVEKYGDAVSGYSATAYEKGLNMDRKPTDILMLLIFIAFVGAMGYLTHYGYKHG